MRSLIAGQLERLPAWAWRPLNALRRLAPAVRRDARACRGTDLAILDFSYVRASGHHHALDHLLMATALQCGLSARVYANKYIASDLIRAGVRPTFRRGVYEAARSAAELEWIQRQIEAQTRVDLALAGVDLWSPPTTLLLHTASVAHILALTRTLVRFGSRCRVNVFLMFPAGYNVPPSQTESQAERYRQAYREAGRSKGSFHFWCESPLLAADYATRGLQGVQHCSLPSVIPGSLPARPERGGRGLSLLFIGDPRADKGFELVLAALPLLQALGQDVTVRLRLTSVSPEQQARLSEFDSGLVDLRLQRYYTDPEYHAELAAADLVLLPYRPDEYRIKNSNIVAEAMAVGTPVLLPPAPNSLVHYCRQFAAGAWVEMREYSARGLVDAVAAGTRTIAATSTAAAAAAPGVRAQREPKAFLAKMLGRAV